MRTPFINHILSCENCRKEGYLVCDQGRELWRGDCLEMNEVNLQIQCRTKQYRLQRQLTDLAEAGEEAALIEWPEVIDR